VTDVAISGLAAANSGPTVLGSATRLTATVAAGTNVTYRWDFGDGSPVVASGSGLSATAAYTYAAVGSYTATVTATNGVGPVAASTRVTVSAPNWLRGGPAGTLPLAVPVRIGGVGGADPYRIDLNQWTGQWQAPQALYDQGPNVHNLLFWHTGIGINAGSTWRNPNRSCASNPNNCSKGILIVDLLTLRSLDRFSIFQMFSGSGKTTHVQLFRHAELSDTPPELLDTGWWPVRDEIVVAAGTNQHVSNQRIADPTLLSTQPFATRYLKIMVRNDGRYGNPSWIELKGIKGFFDPASDMAISGLGVADSGPTVLGSATRLTATVAAGTNVGYTWNFGDGSPVVASGSGLSATLAYTYAAVGSYTVTVTATNSVNQVAASTRVTVTDVAVSGLVAANSGPTVLGSETVLTATVAAGMNVTYTWNFGDGSPERVSGLSATVAYTYAAVGSYTATVTATNGIGQATASTQVTVTNQPPVADAGADQSGVVGDSFILAGSVSDADGHLPLTYSWAQIAGLPVVLNAADTLSPTFTAPATPTVLTFRLAVTDSRGLASSDEVTIAVADVAVVALSATNDSPMTPGNNTVLTATTNLTATNVLYTWDFGDGSPITTTQSPSIPHVYTSAGSYTATVTATNGAGSRSTSTPVFISPDLYVNPGCSLVQAIEAANSDSPVASCGAGSGEDTIVLTGTVSLVQAYGGSDNALPAITSTVTLSGNGFVVSRDGPYTPPFRFLVVGSGGRLTLDRVEMRNGQPPSGAGGGALVVQAGGVLTATHSTFANNNASGTEDGGGAIVVLSNGMANVLNSTFVDNRVSNSAGGGAISLRGTAQLFVDGSTFRSNSAFMPTGFGGGAIGAVEGSSATMRNSTFVGNSTTSGESNTPGGGAIALSSTGQLEVLNSTFSGNSSRNGGAIYKVNGNLQIRQSTFTGNAAQNIGGALYYISGATTVEGSIFSGNTVGVVGELRLGHEIARNSNSPTPTLGYNLWGHAGVSTTVALNNVTPAGTDIVATSNGTRPTALNAILNTTLADNGGPAWSHALLPNSPAIDASGACSVDFDQRGVSRLVGGSSLRACDIGAYEFETAISGLAAANSGPTLLGSATRLTATVAAGTNVGYTWNFGDGTTIVTTTSVLEYVYASLGSYTVTLTAVNSIGSATPTTTLVIVSPIYVNSQATGSGNGTSWANAYNSLTAALSAARQGAHIWVAAGVYKPGSTSTSSFAIPPGVQVYGGFNGTESSLSQRNWRTNVTILSGDVDNNDTNTDGNSIAETTAALAGTNAVHVVTLNGTGGTPITGTTRLDGFVITAGNGDFGGGLYCDGQNGGVCSPSLANLTFSGNRVSDGGGAIVNRGASGTSSPTLTNILFQGNTAFASGAMHNEAQSGGTSSPTLVNVVFYNNSASQEAGVMSNLATAGGTSTPLLVNVTAYGNSGGSGEALWRNYTDTATAGPTVINAVLWGNSGGTLFTAAGSTISHSLVQGGASGTGNLAADPQFVNAAGGDLRLLNSSPAIDAGSNNAPGLAGIIADLAGSARFFDNTAITDTGNGLAPIVDMGAYENQQPPVANAGVDRTAEINQGVTLDGSATNSAYLPLVYQWTQVGGPAVTLSSAITAQPTFTAPAASAVLTFSLTVTDSRGLVSTPLDTVVVTVVPPMPRTGLRMHLPIYETVSTLVRDYSPAGQNATCPVTPTGGAPVLACPTVVADSQRGNVLRFNNSALAVNVVNNFPATALTVAYWVKSTDAADVIPHISYATAAHPDTFLFGFIYDPAFLNRSGATTNVSAYSRSALNNGAWRHVAITWQSAGGAFTLYRDGVAVTSGTLAAGTTMGASGILVFGQDQDSLGGGFDFNQVYRGDLDGVSIYDRVLTVQEIRDHMAATRDDSAITAVAVAASSSTALVGETVRFTATTNSPATNVVYTWEFGDGATASGATASKTYTVPGTYTVMAKASNGASGQSTTTQVNVVLPPFTVTVSLNGDGSVSSTPAGIACGGVCSASFNMPITLTAAPVTGSNFVGWSGACSGRGVCVMTTTQLVTATFLSPPAYLRQWGSGPSTGDTQFQWPVGIAVTGSHVFVGDYWKLRKFDRNGTLVASQWVNTLGMTVEGNTLYLAEGNNRRVWTVGVDSFSVLAQYAADGLLYDVVRHPNGKFYVVRYGQSVYVYSSNFTYESSLLNGQLSGNVRDIAVDSTGALYLADTGNHRILVFDTNGTILRQWGGLGPAPGALNNPWGLAIDRNDWVYVADYGNHRIQVFTRMGEFLTEWGKKDANGLPAAGTGNGEFNGPASLAFDSIGQLYVSDSNNHRVQVFGYPGMLNGTSAQGRPASSGESGPAEPVLSPAPSESPELPASQLYLPLIVWPSTEQEEDFVPLDPSTIPDMPLPPETIPALTPSVPITSTPSPQSP
jgi:PKD repeat protein/sugar lactone lactonase YvrE